MSRPLRIQYPGATYHVTSRGNEKRSTFHTDSDRNRFLDLLAEAVDQFQWILTAYVLMSNHFHLVIELTRANLSKGMHWLNGEYVKWFNREHDRVGHLFQGRAGERLIDTENYMLEVLRYDALNPVRAHMVKSPADYEWSSYRATAGLVEAPEWLAVGEVLKRFGSDRATAQWEYRKFVAAGIGMIESPWDDVSGQIFLGKPEWLDEVRDRIKVKLRDDGHARTQRNAGHEYTMSDVVSAVSSALTMNADWIRTGHGGTARMLCAWLGRYEADLTLAQIAAGLRIRSATGVSNMIRKCDELLERDERLRSDLDRCREAFYDSWKTATL
jgi:putative transposase